MAAERKKKKAPKTESLTIRLDPKMRFALEFVARIKGQTITKVIERAIVDRADSEKVIKPPERGGDFTGFTWRDYWDVSEGIRAVNLARDEDTHPTFDEEEMWDFVKTHSGYFFHDSDMKFPKRGSFDVLWPLMPTLLAIWEETKATNRQSVKSVMDTALVKAGIMKKIEDENLQEADTVVSFADKVNTVLWPDFDTAKVSDMLKGNRLVTHISIKKNRITFAFEDDEAVQITPSLIRYGSIDDDDKFCVEEEYERTQD